MIKARSVTFLRWAARIWFIASIVVSGLFFFGEGLPPLTIKAMLFLFGVVLGLMLAWWFERIGGIITTATLLLFYMVEYFGEGRFPKGYAFMLISAPGVIFLCCGFLRARRMNVMSTEQKTVSV